MSKKRGFFSQAARNISNAASELFEVFHRNASRIPSDLFDETDRQRLTPIVLLGTGLLLSLVAFYVISTPSGLQNLGTVLTSTEFVQFILSLLAALFVTILASYIYASLDRSNLRKKLSFFQNVAHADLMKTIVENLNYFQGRYERDRVEYVTIKKHPHLQGMVLCEIEFSYYKKLPDRNVRFSMFRLGADDAVVNDGLENVRDVVSFLNQYELHQNFDESGLPEEITQHEEFSKSYSISVPLINRSHLLKLSANNGNTLDKVGQIPETVNIDDFVHFSYSITFPMTDSDYYNKKFEFPVFGFELHIDYEDVKDSIDFFYEEHLSTRLSGVKNDSDHKLKHQISHEGWLLPRSAITLMWWKK